MVLNVQKKMDQLLVSAYERSDYYEEKVARLTADMERVTSTMYQSKEFENEASILRNAMASMVSTPRENKPTLASEGKLAVGLCVCDTDLYTCTFFVCLFYNR